VKLRITSEKRSFEAHADVVYSKTGMGMGLAFTTVEPEQLNILDRWLAELSGAAPFEPEAEREQRGQPHQRAIERRAVLRAHRTDDFADSSGQPHGRARQDSASQSALPGSKILS
jgi:hypothetical protein